MLGVLWGGQTDAVGVDVNDEAAEQRGIVLVLTAMVFSMPMVVVQYPAGAEMMHERHHQWNLLSEVVEVEVVAVPNRLKWLIFGHGGSGFSMI